MAARRILAIERGQGTVEWIALLLLVSLALAAIAALIGIGVPGAGLARAVAARIVCAVGLGGDCDPGRARLVEAYGGEIGPLVADHAPTILYEPGMRALPVDYRRCREDACAEGVEAGRVWRSGSGEPAAAFVHAIDCRAGTAAAPSGVDCSGERNGNLYLQYWLYYPGSATGEGSTPLRGVIREVSTAVGRPSFHPDDWESYSVRVGPDGRFARASSHHGYGGGWAPEYGALRVAGGSHAGTMLPRDYGRLTPANRLRLIPLEPIASRSRARFAVTPPWQKRVWRDPEYTGTD